jgi:hypothetical protein
MTTNSEKTFSIEFTSGGTFAVRDTSTPMLKSVASPTWF